MSQDRKSISSLDSMLDNIKEQVLTSIDSYIYTKDTLGSYTYVNQAVLCLFEKNLDEVIGCDDTIFFDMQHAQRLQLNDRLIMADNIIVETEESYYIKAKHEMRTFNVVKKPLYCTDGVVNGMCAIYTDITETLKQQQKINEQYNLLDAILNSIDSHIYMKDAERNFLYVNSKVAELFGKPIADIIGKKDTDILPKHIANHFYQSDKKVFKTGKKQVLVENIQNAQGESTHYLSTKIAFTQSNQPPALLGFSSNVSELFKLKEEFRQLANTDPLTNLCNRRFFTEQARKEFTRAKRYKKSMALISIDIDHFKSINDKYGHPAGDQVLIEVGALIKANLRENDVLARIGGEEFSILLPETTTSSAISFAERIRSDQSQLSITGDWQEVITLSVSVGVSSLTDSDVSFDSLFSRTDKALYQAKNSGRNKVVAL